MLRWLLPGRRRLPGRRLLRSLRPRWCLLPGRLLLRRLWLRRCLLLVAPQRLEKEQNG